jgi:hypothetical protein
MQSDQILIKFIDKRFSIKQQIITRPTSHNVRHMSDIINGAQSGYRQSIMKQRAGAGVRGGLNENLMDRIEKFILP